MRLRLVNLMERKIFNEHFWIVYSFQLALVVIYALAFGFAYLRGYIISDFLISPLLASTYFLIIKIFTHRISLLWTVISTFFITFIIDILVPILFDQTETMVNFINNFWLVFILLLLEILLEEEVLELENQLATDA